MPRCTIGLLVNAAHLVYRIEGVNNALRRDEDTRNGNVSTTELVDAIAKTGYLVTEKTNADVINSKGLTALCLQPNDEESPIIIAYKGTDSIRDMRSNIKLGLTGTAEKKLREEAFYFYTKTKQKFPDREIIITGHSLGGHLAQYVGAKAYATDSDLRKSMSLHVRTFNTAPINTAYGQKLESLSPDIFSQFCNYRLDRDLISRLLIQQYYGNTYSFRTEKNRAASHLMGAMREVLPESIQNLEIGGASKVNRDLNTLKEAVIGIKEAYAARIKGQWFSKYRMGSTNKIIIDKALDAVTEELNKNPPDFLGANKHLQAAKFKTSGTVSRSCLNCLIMNVLVVYKEFKVLPEDSHIFQPIAPS